MNINFNEISTIVLALISTPAVASIIAAVCSYVKNKHTVNNEIKKPLDNVSKQLMKENEELKTELMAAHRENRMLMKKINELLTSLDKIDRTKEEI